MKPPTDDEIQAAYDKITADGPFAEITMKLSIAATRNPLLIRYIERVTDIVKSIMPKELFLFVQGFVAGSLVYGLHMGMHLGEARQQEPLGPTGKHAQAKWEERLDKVQRAHDLLAGIVLGDAPLGLLSPEDREMIEPALNALCFVLGHDHNTSFAQLLVRIELTMTEAGFAFGFERKPN